MVIATPHSTHLPLALVTAAAGKHVYLEKPMALDVAECDQIIAACRAAGVLLTIAKQTRHMEMSMRAKPLVDEGRIGEILFLRPMSVTPRRGLRQRPPELAVRSARGRRVPRLGRACVRRHPLVHRGGRDPGLRRLRQLHRPAAREADGVGPVPDVEPVDRPGPHVVRDRPVRVRHATNNQYQIVGTEGSIFWDLDRVDLVTGDRDVQTWELPSWTLPDFKPRDPRRVGNTARQLVDFIESVRTGERPAITGEDGRAAIEMTQAAKLSAQTGRAVDLPARRGTGRLT